MWTGSYWKQVVERMVKSVAATLLSTWVVGDGILNAFSINANESLGIGIGAAVVSLLMSIVSAPIGEPGTPSLVPTPARRD